MHTQRSRLLVLVATPDVELCDRLVQEVRRSGNDACIAQSAMGCLRVATAVAPDLVLLDASLPRNLEGMLRTHPATATTELRRVGAAVLPAAALRLTPELA